MMNKQEAIEFVENISYSVPINSSVKYLREETVVDIIKQLDEPERPPEPEPLKPEKPVVPQFVADYIDSEQNSWSTLSEALDNMDDEKRILDWFYVNSETFAKAWLYGYEIEKEKLYTVKFANEDFGEIYIGIFKAVNKLGISSLPLNDDGVKSWFTKDELERFNFWDNPAFEIKEVKK